MKTLGEIDSQLLVFGGAYSNLAATIAMRTKAEELGIAAGHIICTGDIVAYCAEPRQTVELIRDWGIHVIMGNCEESLATLQQDCGCGFEEGSACSTLSIAWYQYASQHIDQQSRQWMGQLARSITFQLNGYRCRVVHGSVTNINQFIFPSTALDIKRQQITKAEAEVVIGGHCGIPFGQSIEDKLWLNAGVIGLPANDGSADGWYMLLQPEDDGFQASWHRLSYDAESSRNSTLAAGMTEYAQSLTSGLWPSMDVLPPSERATQGKRVELTPLRINPESSY